MSALLARLGHRHCKAAAYSLRSTSKKPTKNDRQFVDIRANIHQTLSQSRSYGDAFRTSVPENGRRREETESPSSHGQTSARKETQQQQREQHIHNHTADLSESTLVPPNAVSAEPPSPPYPARDPRPSARASLATRESEDSISRTVEQQLDLWEQFERNDENDNSPIDWEPRQDVPTNESAQPSFRPLGGADNMLKLDYKAELPFALLNRQADTVVRCLFAAIDVNDREFLRDLPATTFSEIVRVLEPRHSLSQLASIHLGLSTAVAQQLGIAPMRQVAYEYASVLKEVYSIRRNIRKTLFDFKVLLRSARDLGNRKFAMQMWNALLEEGHTPDTNCYNLYLASVVFNNVHNAKGRQKIRVIDFNMVARSKERPSRNFRQYRVGAGGVRELTMTVFNEMLANGAEANEESFRILMTAASREGDLTTVKSILKKVWSIDIDALIAGEDESAITPKAMPTHSPLHPTPQLLFVIAQAFGSNNDIPTALRAVDFVARHYDLPITRTVWMQLFEWTFVLSIDRYGNDKATGSMVGQLPADSVTKLWDTMTSAPYHVKPTIEMYNHLIKNLFQLHRTPKIVEKMREGHAIYLRHRRMARILYNTLLRKLQDVTTSKETVEKLRRRFEAADLFRKRDLHYVKRWMRLMLGSYREYHRVERVENSYATRLPLLLWEWRGYAPTNVQYETPSGFVEFEIRTPEEILKYHQDRLEHKTRIQEGLRGAERYIGERWAVDEPRAARRLQAMR